MINYTTSKKRRAEYILHELERLYPETPCPLDNTSPYTLLIAVLLSAQCTDERVNKVTPALFELASNPFDMIKVKVEQIKAEALYQTTLKILKNFQVSGIKQPE
jgi:endonuclease-3